MLTVRLAEERDIPALMGLLAQVAAVHHNGRPDLFRGSTTKYSEADLAKLLADETRPVFVCEADGRVAGHAFCIRQQVLGDRLMTDALTLYIDDICVDEDCRRQGVGRALFEYVKAYARENGFYNLTLNVWALNQGALRFYESCGLVPQKVGMEMILR